MIECDAQHESAEDVLNRVTDLAASITVSAGYVLWCLRGAGLLASLFSSLPVWRWFDPLPVLASWEAERKKQRTRSTTEPDEDPEEQNITSLLE